MVAASATLFAAQARAQDDVETPREYNVEIIVFVYEEEVSVGNEVFVPEPPPGEPDGMATGPDADFGFDDRSGPGRDQPTDSRRDRSEEDEVLEKDMRRADYARALPEFVITPVNELGMTDIISRLERLDVYDPVLHTAWTQPALPLDQSITIDLGMLTSPPPGLSGEFTLYLSRYLHLMVDLTLDDGNAQPVAVELPRQSFFYDDETQRRPSLVQYRIQDDRIFKNGDTRYFDHPRFGAIARVSRIEVPEDDDEDSGGADVLGDVAGDEIVE